MKLMAIILHGMHIDSESWSIQNNPGENWSTFGLAAFAASEEGAPRGGIGAHSCPVQGCIQPVSEMVAISESIWVRMMWK